jgi:serine/threonine protein kinase/WD40 repeat protein
MNDRPNREETIFHAALELAPDKRGPYLALACGNDEALRRRIEVLLQADAEADPFFHKDALNAALGADPQGKAIAALPVTEKAGDTIGRYKLLQQIGEGGCGVVYMAEQEEPVRRRVALKVIKLGMDTRNVIARFEAERQALALMDHPNIAKVLDVGATETGRPYFVMELVRGIKITDYCDQNNLSTGARLDLFTQVCNAIQHAHQKGIIHRDIKPSNILVSLHDGMPVPVVIDFGIAKATEQRLTDKTLFTAFEQFIGTPAYTSPEQAGMSRSDVDTRSDIYSLGVLLYELLTGRTPFETEALLAAGLDQMRRTIREQEPVRPSTRLATLQVDELTTTAKRRSADAPKLIHLLKGDLDWIVMKCLEKDRTRRYETANGLALDIKRHLDNEPVVARSPTAVYRFQKAWRRNKASFTAGSIVLLSLVVGGAVSTWQAIRASRQQVKAETNEQMAVQAQAEAIKERRLAEEATERAEQKEAEMRRRAYAADMNLAHQAVGMNNLGQAWELLTRYLPEPGKEDLRGWEWRYLWGRSKSHAIFTLPPLPDLEAVVSIAMRPGANWVAIGGDRGRGVEVWDLSTRGRVAQLASGEPFAHAAFSPDGRRLAFSTGGEGDEPKRLRLWDCVNKETLAEAVLEGPVVSLTFAGDGQRIVTFQPNKAVTQWRVSDLKEITSRPVPEGHAWLGSPFAISPDLSTAVVVSGWDGIVVVDLESGKERWRTNSSSQWANVMAISPDGTRLATSFNAAGGAIAILDLATGATAGRLEGHRAWVSALMFWPDGKTLISASADRTIQIWDLELGQSIRTLRGHKHEIWSLAMSSDATTLVSGGKDGEVLVWDTRGDSESRSSWTVPGCHWAWRFSSDDRAIYAVEATAAHQSKSLQSSGRQPTRGQAIDAFERDPGRLLCYHAPKFEQAEVLPEVQFDGDFAFSRSGRLFAASMTNGLLRVWDLDEKRLAQEFATGARHFRPVAFSRDESRVWLLEWPRDQVGRSALTEWDLRTGRPLRSIPDVPDQNLTFYPDDWVLWKAEGETVVFYDLRAGEVLQPPMPTGHLVALHGSPSASPDGRLLVLSHNFGVLTVWDTASLGRGATPRRVATLGGIMLSFSDSFFTPDGARLFGGAYTSEAVKIWETRDYQQLLTLQAEGTHFHNFGMSADGALLGVLSAGGTIHFWRAPTWEEIENRQKADRGASRN